MSVGIDVGTATTQMVVSRLKAENTSADFLIPSVQFTARDVLYQSPVHLTPLLSESLIDAERLACLILEEYRLAGIGSADVDTGAVIITGETARKENAQRVTEQLSQLAGDYVVATAGPDMEAILAGHGSGAADYSRESGRTVANMDIGGGTTNVAVFREGEAVAYTCLDVGGRLIRTDGGRIVSIAPGLQRFCRTQNLFLEAGATPGDGELEQVCRWMAETVVDCLCGKSADHLSMLKTSNSGVLPGSLVIEDVVLSGGVGGCFYREELGNDIYHDIGLLLAEAFRQSALPNRFQVIPARQTVRATAIGAGSHATEMSGSTIAFTGIDFPLRGLPVLRLEQTDVLYIKERIGWLFSQQHRTNAALWLQGARGPGFEEVRRLAQNLADAADCLPPEAPLVVIVEEDFAKALGQALRLQLPQHRELLCIDGIQASHADFIDIGRPLMNSAVVPVIVKTLLFG